MAQANIHYKLLDDIRATFWYDIINTTYSKAYMGWAAESRVYHREPIDFADIHEPITEINIIYLDSTFDDIPDEAKKLMNVTDFLKGLSTCDKTHPIPGWLNASSTHSYSFTKVSGRVGTLQITYKNEHTDADIETHDTECLITESYTIPAVIHFEHKFYALTPEFIAWCKEECKPKRNTWFTTLTFQ